MEVKGVRTGEASRWLYSELDQAEKQKLMKQHSTRGCSTPMRGVFEFCRMGRNRKLTLRSTRGQLKYEKGANRTKKLYTDQGERRNLWGANMFNQNTDEE